MRKVLILDANQRSALAATRSLGKRGVAVTAADETPKTLAGSSKYCQDRMTYPAPHRDPEGFLATLRMETFRRQIGVVFPMTDITTSLLVHHRDSLGPLQIPCPSVDSFRAALDKWSTYNLAVRLGIPTPVTHSLTSEKDLSTALSDLGYPIVLKPRRPPTRLDTHWKDSNVRYAVSAEELETLVRKSEMSPDQPILAQQYIKGEGRGIFALYDRGKPVCFFAHRRLRERPPSGGVSVLSESAPLDPYLRDLTQRILDALVWHGVAMVEFKIALDGNPYLLEINGRFWGSLQLALDAGMDFPWLLFLLTTGDTTPCTPDYRIGLRSRWLLGDIDNLYLSLRSQSGLVEKYRTITRFFGSFNQNTRFDVNRWGDLNPFLFELQRFIRHILR